MITEATLASIGRTVQQRHRPAWAELRADAAAVREAGWPKGALVSLVGRAETLAATQADAVIAAVRPLLARFMTTPQARRAMDDHLATMRAGVVAKLLPGGLTVAAVEAKLAEAEEQDREINDEFANLLAEALEEA